MVYEIGVVFGVALDALDAQQLTFAFARLIAICTTRKKGRIAHKGR